MSEIMNDKVKFESFNSSLSSAMKMEEDSLPPSSKAASGIHQEYLQRRTPEVTPEGGLRELQKLQREHTFWDNRFFKACLAGHLTKEDFGFVYGQYYLYSKNFTRYLSALMANCDNDLFRSRISENLWEEGGGIAPEKRHAEIFRRFLTYGLEIDVNDIDYLDSTRFFVREYLDFCLHSHPSAASAFLSLGTEGIVGRMYGIVVEGLLKAGVPEAHLTFFRIHMECDDEHSETIEKIMLSYSSMPDWYNTCYRSMMFALDLRERFFEKIYDQLIVRRLRPVLDNIQNRESLAPELPSAAELLHRMDSTTGEMLYSNLNERLNIDFAVERVPFKADVFDTRILRIAAHKNNELHKHPHESIFYVISGEGKVHVNNVVIDIKPGDIVFVPRWAMHQSHNTTDAELLILALTDFSLTERIFVGNHLTSTRMKGAQAAR
jgi:pyrroloquinoline quinone (PQQ) biosynthesis protein C/mannose-6-phosphate isomerase-like protein (cupin superfamily)